MKETQVWSLSRDQRSPGEGNSNLLWYSCLENPMDGGAWWATVHGVARVGHDVATEPTSHPGPITLHSAAIFSLSQQMYQISIALVYVSEPDHPRSLAFCSLCFNRDRFTTQNISKQVTHMASLKMTWHGTKDEQNRQGGVRSGVECSFK